MKLNSQTAFCEQKMSMDLQLNSQQEQKGPFHQGRSWKSLGAKGVVWEILTKILYLPEENELRYPTMQLMV